MKKIVYSLALFLTLAAFSCASAQEIRTETVYVPQNTDFVSMRQNIERPISQLYVNGKSAVKLVYDTTNYIVVGFERNESNPLENKWVIVKGMTLIIDDPDGYAFYEIHLKKNELQLIKNSFRSTIIYASAPYVNSETDVPTSYETSGNIARKQQLDEAQRQLDEARNGLSKALIQKHGERIETHTYITDTLYVDSTDELIPLEPITVEDFPTGEVIEVIEDGDSILLRQSHYQKYHYDWEDRSGMAFLWGFNNWGSNWYNGLNKMDGAYELRTSFSSWQLEFNYAIIVTRHFNLDIGIGYESDIYKFSTPLVDIDNNGIFQDRNITYPNYSNYTTNNQVFDNTHLNDWSSRFVTRYFSLPIGIVFRFNDFKIGFTAVPALSFISSHTGLKHEIDAKNIEYQDAENISNFITPYKLDLRFTLRYAHFGIFAQVATTSLFNNKDVYPFKIGFIIK